MRTNDVGLTGAQATQDNDQRELPCKGEQSESIQPPQPFINNHTARPIKITQQKVFLLKYTTT